MTRNLRQSFPEDKGEFWTGSLVSLWAVHKYNFHLLTCFQTGYGPSTLVLVQPGAKAGCTKGMVSLSGLCRTIGVCVMFCRQFCVSSVPFWCALTIRSQLWVEPGQILRFHIILPRCDILWISIIQTHFLQLTGSVFLGQALNSHVLVSVAEQS